MEMVGGRSCEGQLSPAEQRLILLLREAAENLTDPPVSLVEAGFSRGLRMRRARQIRIRSAVTAVIVVCMTVLWATK